MRYTIVELEQFSGYASTIYSVILDGENDTLFEKFVEENVVEFRGEIKDILARLKIIGNDTGARIGYFKEHEGKQGDHVCALYDIPEKHLRLYCIRFGIETILLGGGGPKYAGVIAWQDDEKLTEEAERIIAIAKDIFRRIESGDLYWSKDRTRLEGDLNYDNYEE